MNKSKSKVSMVLQVLYAWIHLPHKSSPTSLLAVILDCALSNFDEYGHSVNCDYKTSYICVLSESTQGQ